MCVDSCVLCPCLPAIVKFSACFETVSEAVFSPMVVSCIVVFPVVLFSIMSDRVGMFDYALKSAGGCIASQPKYVTANVVR